MIHIILIAFLFSWYYRKWAPETIHTFYRQARWRTSALSGLQWIGRGQWTSPDPQTKIKQLLIHSFNICLLCFSSLVDLCGIAVLHIWTLIWKQNSSPDWKLILVWMNDEGNTCTIYQQTNRRQQITLQARASVVQATAHPLLRTKNESGYFRMSSVTSLFSFISLTISQLTRKKYSCCFFSSSHRISLPRNLDTP